MLYITDKAVRMIRLSAESGEVESLALRVSYHPDQVGPAQYRMGFDAAKPADTSWECQGVPVVVDEKSRPHLEHVVLDFQDLPDSGPQFVFLSPRP